MPRTILIIALFAVSLLMASEPFPYPPSPSMQTWQWLPPSIVGDFQLQNYPENSINMTYTVRGSVVGLGYPYHYGAVWGVNDTVFITVLFENNSNNDMSFIGLQPQDWFYPVLYDPAVNVFRSSPLADTSAFNYRFEHWINMLNEIPTEKPDTLRSKPIHQWRVHPRGLIISIWGLYPGRYRVVLQATSSKPSNVNLVMSSPENVVNIVSGIHAKDTINAYVELAKRSYLRQELTMFDTYINNIFSINPKALPGWFLRYQKHIGVGDTLNAEMAIDSILYYIENYVDPMMPDSTSMDEVNKTWLDNLIGNYKYLLWRLRNPEEAKNIFPM